jgi:3-deoxy-D-manno-octulosonate 8-phosphate phosphatase (KDO 8-P phosphatase)
MIDDAELRRRAAGLEWLLLDVDGVLTDGRLVYDGNGERLKLFHVRDGLGVRMARGAGLKVGILSGRASAALTRRARDLGIDALISGRSDKATAYAEFLADHRADPDRVAFVGDDLLDLPVLGRCGLSFCPADAVDEVRDRVDHVLERSGGNAAVRELVELLLRARGSWAAAVAPFVEPLR